MQPYEPPGSIKYYPRAQIARLQDQANQQEQVNQIKNQIQEILPDLAARAAELNQRFNAQPANYEAYTLKKLGPNSDLYKVMHPSQDFQYKKKRSSGTIVDKGEETSFLRLAEKEWRVFYNMSPGEENGIFYEDGKRDWWRNVCKNDAILTPLRDYEDKLLKDSWIKSIDSDGRGYADQIAKLEQTTDNVVNNVQDFSNNISVSVNDAINTTANNLSNAVEGFGDSAATVTSNIATSLDAYQAPTVTGPSNIQNVDATNVGSLDLTNTVNQGIDALNSSLNAATTALNTGFANLDTGLSNAGTAVESFGSNIQVGTQQLSAQIQTTAANLSADITEGIQNITDDTVNLIESTSDIIGDGIALANDIQSIVDVGRGDEMYDYNSDKRKRAPRGDHGDRKGRLLKRKKYTKLCIAAYLFVEKVRKESSGLVNANGDAVDIFDKASEIDLSFTDYRSVIDQALNDIKQIDNDLVTSTTQAQFIAIYDKLLQTQAAFDDIDLTIFEQGEALKKQIDEIFKYMILQQYSAIQHVRKKLYDGTNKKYFIVWSAGAQAVIESVVGGKVFDNYQPSDYNQE